MTIVKRNEKFHSQTRVINVGGDDITVIQPSFEVSEVNWDKFKKVIRVEFLSDKAKSHALRILVNAVNLELVDLKDLEKKIEKAAEKVDEVIYI